LGFSYYQLGQYQQAIDYHQQSLAIFRELGNREGESVAIALDGLGAAYFHLGQYQQATDYHQQSLSLHGKLVIAIWKLLS
jgi:tetratricopeptide (TPR) repeat protein